MSDSVSNETHGGRKAAMSFILIAVLIDMVSIGLIIPVLPVLVGTFTESETRHTLAQLAVAFAFGLANFFGAPFLGGLSDRFGRRKVMLIGFSGLALSFFVTAMASALWMLVVVRLFSGAMQANAAVANAYVADITPPADRAKRFGMLGAAFGMGFILGPVLGGLLGSIDLHLPFFVAGSLALLNWCYGYFVLPESLAPEHRRPFNWRKANPFASLARVRGLRGVGPLVYVIACSGLAQLIIQTCWVIYNQHKFGWGPRENGLSLFAVGLMAVIVQGGLLQPLMRWLGPRKLVLIGLVSSIVTNLVWGMAEEGWMMVGIIFFNIVGFAAPTALQSLVSNAADARNQGETMGAVSAINSLMAVLAPIFGLGLMAVVAELPRADWRLGAPFYLCAGLQAVSLYFSWRHFHDVPAQAAAPAKA
ncbi:MFS transporter, DHA1 family, tetracycline resistance protein [Roseateles sp. YR242]|uniref:MFS transporter n=1 Tax=Roseateles sp. YR242 TaxID=1855305 RepID=UPI0008ABFD69|nr:MFS transporter [Roseateles sp. YR242]SEK30298.1 MFS transporter, DHA1 family, tetracycline resistance protein [Roseateles sp. YR242]